jgi:hypothetical protein
VAVLTAGGWGSARVLLDEAVAAAESSLAAPTRQSARRLERRRRMARLEEEVLAPLQQVRSR